jgi:gamma-glutamyltranspeptidase/glutathione hydrolase
MILLRRFAFVCLLSCGAGLALGGAVPVTVQSVLGERGLVVAGHPEAAAIGVGVLQRGGNAVDAAVAVSLALGVAEPYGSGLGGKLMLLYYEAKTGRTYALDALDAAGSLDVADYLRRPEQDRSYGYGSVCVPGLPAGLWAAHQKWGRAAWPELVAPAARLARDGFEVLPKTRDFFAEQERKLRAGDPEIARLYLPGGKLPAVGSRLANADLAKSLEAFAAHGRDGFYRGWVAEALVDAMRRGGGVVSARDLADYEPRLVEPLTLDFRGHRLLAAPPPTNGAPLVLTILKVLEDEPLAAPLRRAETLDLVGRVWRQVYPLVQAGIGDVPEAAFNYEKLVAPDSIAALRAKAHAAETRAAAAFVDDSGFSSDVAAATTHFAVADAEGNLVCATQSQSLHFGAGVVAPGTGIVLNDSMSNFGYSEPRSVNYVAPGKRPRSTIAPMIVFRDGRPVFAIGLPGASRIPTALVQALLDRLALGRSFADAIGDTRLHWDSNWRRQEIGIEAEESLPPAEVERLRALGWKVTLAEPPGTGRHFGGINVIELREQGGYVGYADPRRTNAAAGY